MSSEQPTINPEWYDENQVAQVLGIKSALLTGPRRIDAFQRLAELREVPDHSSYLAYHLIQGSGLLSDLHALKGFDTPDGAIMKVIEKIRGEFGV